jgi:PAS domain S-box-containing protein
LIAALCLLVLLVWSGMPLNHGLTQVAAIRDASLLAALFALLLGVAFAGNRSLRHQIDLNSTRLARTVEEKVRLSEALHTSHDRYRLLVDSVQEYAIFLLTADGEVASWNIGAERVKGYSAEEALGLPFARFYPPEDVEAGAPARALEHSAAAGRFECEGWRLRRDGSRFWATVVVTALTDDDGGLCGFSCITRDVTERRRAEAQLAFQARVLSQVNEPIVGIDADGRVTYWNAGAERLYGVLAADAVGRPLVDSYTLRWVRPGDEERAKATFAATGSWFGEQIHRRRSGEELYVESFISVLTDDRGEPIGSLAAARDVTERRRVREALHARAHQQAALAALGQHALAESNFDALLDEAVRTLIRTLDVDCAHVVELAPDSQSLTLRCGVGLPQTVQHTAMGMGNASQAGYTLTVDEPVIVSELVRDMRFTDRTFLADEGIISGVSVIIRLGDGPFGVLSAHTRTRRTFTTDDVHFLESVANVLGVTLQRVRAEAALRESEVNYQHTQKLESLGILAGGIAHDFNNLLLGVLGHAGLARMELAPESPVQNRLEQIETTAQRAAELTNQMLAYSGKGRFVVQPMNLTELVQEMTHLLQTVVSKKAELRVDFASCLPAVNADGSQLRQVVMNLITNASDALGDADGTITIRTGLVHADATYLADTYVNTRLPSGPYVFVEVSDTGCGMDATTRARIFDPFFTTKFTGRGLGLAAVLGIVRGHHGAIKLYSEPKLGTIFKVLLPAASASVQAVEKPAPAQDGWRSGGLVLVVDDEEGVRTVAQGVLERVGFDVLEARDGREGVDVFRERAGDIRAVLLDMTMPRMSGVEALREIRRIRQDVPVILSSGYSEEDAADHFRFGEDEMSGFIQKPYAAAGLVDKLREVLEA